MTAVPDCQSDDAFVDEFLQGTSRTFALAIPLLEPVRRRQVGVSYLLFRVADSIEDAPDADAVTKKTLLQALVDCLGDSGVGVPRHRHGRGPQPPDLSQLWSLQTPTGRLLCEFPRLLGICSQFPDAVSHVIGEALRATASGMSGFIDASTGFASQIRIRTVGELKLYCYVVAGIVGEMLTELFMLHYPPGQVVHSELRRLSKGFGEFLQLINILKDSDVDAAGGREFIPVDVSRDSVQELARLGRSEALSYVRMLEAAGFPSDVVLFCRFLFLLADRSLERLREGGAGSKLTRWEVQQLLSEVRAEGPVMPV